MMAGIRRQEGMASVEFAFLAAALMLVLFGIVELGRTLFVLNALTESSRRGARMAAVCSLNDPAIAQSAVFDGAAIVPQLTTDHINVQYLDEASAPTGAFSQIRYVRVSIEGYRHRLLIPFLSLDFNSPDLAATLPRESLGWVEDGFQPC